MGKCVISLPTALETPCGKVMVIPVSVENPHAVIFVSDADKAPLTTLGKNLEHHAFFKDGVNIEFIQIIDRTTLRMRVWERGSGVTILF